MSALYTGSLGSGLGVGVSGGVALLLEVDLAGFGGGGAFSSWSNKSEGWGSYIIISKKAN